MALAALNPSSFPVALRLPLLTPPLPVSVNSFKTSNVRMLRKGGPRTMGMGLKRLHWMHIERMSHKKARSEAEPVAS
jgi:hypothetical protein